jgi:ankyrin repeat protein
MQSAPYLTYSGQDLTSRVGPIDLEHTIVPWRAYQQILGMRYFYFSLNEKGVFVINFSPQKCHVKNYTFKTLRDLKNILFKHYPEAYASKMGKNFLNLAKVIKNYYFSLHKSNTCQTCKRDLEILRIFEQIQNRMTLCPTLNSPEDILKHIFSYLSVNDLCQFESVNRLAYSQAKWVWANYALTLQLKDINPDHSKKNIVNMIESLKRFVKSKLFPPEALRRTLEHNINYMRTLTELRRNYKNALNRAFYYSLDGLDNQWQDILTVGANPIQKFKEGDTPLLKAIRNSNYKVVDQIIFFPGLNINEANDYGCTAVHLVAETHNVDKMQQLLQHGANLNAQTPIGITPLHIACASNQHEMVKYILKNRADLEAKDDRGKTPIFYALGFPDITHELIQAGALINIPLVKKDMMRPVHYAIKKGCFDTACMLIEAGASIKDPLPSGKTILHFAVQSAKIHMTTLYKSQTAWYSYFDGYELQTAAKSVEVFDCFYASLLNPQLVNVVEKLIAKGANAAAVDKSGKTPLEWLMMSLGELKPKHQALVDLISHLSQ